MWQSPMYVFSIVAARCPQFIHAQAAEETGLTNILAHLPERFEEKVSVGSKCKCSLQCRSASRSSFIADTVCSVLRVLDRVY
jgi:hypothetical protein